MKLKLNREKDVFTLAVNGVADEQNYAVLRAGIAQLFKTGKNKILLDLTEMDDIDERALSDIGQLNVLAKEMLGEIAIAGLRPSIRQRLLALDPPPNVQVFANVPEAIKVMLGHRPFISASEATLKELEELRKKVQQYESQADSAKLRTENSDLKAQVERLEKQLRALMIQNREPSSLQDWRDRYQLLEDQIADLMNQQGQGQPAKK